MHGLVRSLAPALRAAVGEATGGELSEIEWFSSAWQHGGADTGLATLRLGGAEAGVFVKLPMGPREHTWTTRLGEWPVESFVSGRACDAPTPRVIASGRSLGHYDLAWAVTERFGGDPVGSALCKADVLDLMRAAASFQKRALDVQEVGTRPPSPDWDAAAEMSRARLNECGIAEPQRWNEALKRVQKALPRLKMTWATREVNAWCHGDLHPGNAMRREPDRDGGDGQRGAIALVDLGEVHAGHWVEDALYLEHLFWGRAEKLFKVKPVGALARERKKLGLACVDGYAEVADAKRVLTAACVPGNYPGEGDAVYCAGALETLERLLPLLGV